MVDNLVHPPRLSFEGTDLNGLLPLLQWLDARLEQLMAAYGQDRPPAPTVQAGSARALPLSQLPASGKPSAMEPAPEADLLGNAAVGLHGLGLRQGSAIAWLGHQFSLSPVELGVVIVALAPELDRRYEQAYAYLQADTHHLRPTVDLALQLLCTTALERLEQRRMFAGNGALLHHDLLHLVASAEGSGAPLLRQELHLAEPVVQLLLGQLGLPPTLRAYGYWHSPSHTLEAALLDPGWEVLQRLAMAEGKTQRPLRLYVQGADRDRTRALILALAAQLQIPVISAELGALVRDKAALEPLLKQMARSAWFQGALLWLENLDALQEPDQQHCYGPLWEAVAEHPGLTVLTGSAPYRVPPHNRVAVVTVPLPALTVKQRRVVWQQELTAAGVRLKTAELEELCDRYHLTPSQIAIAVTTAQATAHSNAPTHHDLLAAARAQSGHDLAAHAQKVDAPYHWDDLVLPEPTKTLLQQLCDQAKYRHQVQDLWGFGQKLALGNGLTALFAGPPGTGKTMAASVIAQALELDLYKIDLSQVVSKYIGETEKSLGRIFAAAASANAVLLFDEADALFGKRTEVKDAHDRYANIETSYLLQKMEEYPGIAILTTNLQGNMDDAFVRRLRFIVEFPLPGVAERRRIWQQIWPDALPLEANVDLNFLAENLEIAGGVIRNIALQAAYLAAAAGAKPVGMAHIIPAVRQEYQKIGKILMRDDLKEYGKLC